MTDEYLFSGQLGETERLQLQSRVWEPAGRSLLDSLPAGTGLTALDVGCGAMGWLRLLSEWVGPSGRVVGTDLDGRLLGEARRFAASAHLDNVALERDDLFATRMPAASWDLVHARFLMAPLGRSEDQVAAYRRLVAPGGWLVLEEPDISSWRVNPESPAVERLIAHIGQAFAAAGGDFSAGRQLPTLLRALGMAPHVRAHVLALEPRHPYLRLPLQFASSLRPRLETVIGPRALDDLQEEVEAALDRPGTWGTTFTLVQAWAGVE